MGTNPQTNATRTSTQISQNIPVFEFFIILVQITEVKLWTEYCFRSLQRLYPKLKRRNTIAPLFRIGDIVAKRWIISGLIGRGGYGQIFFAVDSRREELRGVAIKTELKIRKGKIAKRMILEQKVLLRLQGRAHVPLLWGSGSTKTVNYIIMQLLSQNVNDIRKQSPFKRFSRPTMARIVIQFKQQKNLSINNFFHPLQGIAGLRDMHQIGYIHRDIKPHNLCFGLSEVSKHRLVIVDYGLARRFRYPNGRMRPLRRDCGFRGTTLYASLRAHEGKDLGPSDDLVCLFYAAIEMVLGNVPWKQARKNEEVKALKEAIQDDDFQSVTEKVGESLREFGRAVCSMDANDEPNYVALQNIMLEFTNHRQLSDPYDWDNDFEEVFHENDINQAIVKNE
uniref:non-specific serine/threonine protein kinase n=1 Tax=Elaeophora elaphi TaxID=1147741 RepID=A0A0R3RSR3_9BILA